MRFYFISYQFCRGWKTRQTPETNSAAYIHESIVFCVHQRFNTFGWNSIRDVKRYITWRKLAMYNGMHICCSSILTVGVPFNIGMSNISLRIAFGFLSVFATTLTRTKNKRLELVNKTTVRHLNRWCLLVGYALVVCWFF